MKPPTNAAGCHFTHRRSRMNIDSADSTGDIISAIFILMRGPKMYVIGERIMPINKTPVCERRLIPSGGNIAEEYSGLCPFRIA